MNIDEHTFFNLNKCILDYLEKNGEAIFLSIIDNEFGGWPLIRNNFEVLANETLIQKMVRIRKLGFKPLIDIHVTLNPKDPQYLMLKVIYNIYFKYRNFSITSIWW